MSTTFVLVAAVVLSLALVAAALADTPSWGQFIKVVVIAAVVLLALIGMGSVFGKTLGDFLRQSSN